MIDVLKIDIEGSELVAINSTLANGFLSSKVKIILIEWHFWQPIKKALEVFLNFHRQEQFLTFYTDPRFDPFVEKKSFYLVESLVNKRFL